MRTALFRRLLARLLTAVLKILLTRAKRLCEALSVSADSLIEFDDLNTKDAQPRRLLSSRFSYGWAQREGFALLVSLVPVRQPVVALPPFLTRGWLGLSSYQRKPAMSEAKSPLSEKSTAAQWVAAHESQEPIEMAEQIREAPATNLNIIWHNLVRRSKANSDWKSPVR